MSVEGGPSLLLHLIHGLGGGSEAWLRAFGAADPPGANLVLRAAGGPAAWGARLQLHRLEAPEVPLATWELAAPVPTTCERSPEVRAVVAEVLREYPVAGVLVSSLLGFSLDVLRTGLPTAMLCQDFFPMCAAIHLHFEGVCTRCEAERLARCLAENPLRRGMPDQDAAGWLALRRRLVADLLEAGARLVAPTRTTLDQLRALWPELAAVPGTVLPLDIEEPLAGLPDRPRPVRARPRYLVLGRLDPHKGRDLLASLVERVGEDAEFCLLGAGGGAGPLAGRSNVRVVPAYRRGHLRGLIHALDPDLGLLLSVWPETYSYTLSELQSLGVPVVATRLGAFAERIEHGRDGLLVEPDAARIAATLAALAADPGPLATIRTHLAGRPRLATSSPGDYRRALGLG